MIRKRYILLISLFLTFSNARSQSNLANLHGQGTPERTDSTLFFESPDIGYEFYLSNLDKQTPLSLEYNDDVKRYIELFLHQRKPDLEIYLARAETWMPLIEQQLDRYNLPLELKYIAVIESGMNPLACSKSGAVGLWQFLFNTCSLFDLRVDSYIDERRDPYKSTDAACRYLQYLYNTFNDWNLVMASYNGGPGEVRKAIERSGGKTNYWEIRPYLSEQARNYVPSFIAMNYLMKYYALHGIHPSVKVRQFINTDTIYIQYSIGLPQIAEVLELPVSTLEFLNPVYRTGVIPESPRGSMLVLPENKIGEYLRKENKVILCQTIIPNYTNLVTEAGNTADRKKITHIVEKGEYFHKIALKYNCTVENIKAWNNLDSTAVHPGQILEIWVPDGSKL
jgi:membrane-bound lytic murein transglycosylase D